jgi:hypothetical protein
VRFFVLKEGDMWYCTDETMTEVKGKIPLQQCTVENAQDPKHPFTFLIKPTLVRKDFLMSAQTAEDKEDW